jgi:DNA (cytosine-5)-methyltransferase 1
MKTMEIHKFPYNWRLSEANFTKDKGKVFSCFACGGGSTMGYKLAGFDVIGCNEIDPKVNRVYVANHAPRFNFLEDIREMRERATARIIQLGYSGRFTAMLHILHIWQP